MINRPVGGPHETGPTVGGGQEVKWSMFFLLAFISTKTFMGDMMFQVVVISSE